LEGDNNQNVKVDSSYSLFEDGSFFSLFVELVVVELVLSVGEADGALDHVAEDDASIDSDEFDDDDREDGSFVL